MLFQTVNLSVYMLNSLPIVNDIYIVINLIGLLLLNCYIFENLYLQLLQSESIFFEIFNPTN